MGTYVKKTMQQSNTRLFHAIKLECPLKNKEQMTYIHVYWRRKDHFTSEMYAGANYVA